MAKFVNVSAVYPSRRTSLAPQRDGKIMIQPFSQHRRLPPDDGRHFAFRQPLAEAAMPCFGCHVRKLRMSYMEQRLVIACLHINLRLCIDTVVDDTGSP